MPFASGSGGGAGTIWADAAWAADSASAAAAAPARIEWNEGILQHSIMIPAVSAGAYTAARERAAFVERGDRGGIVVSGADRASYLQGLLTNDIAA
ncbi:MAG: hypothetical protein DMF93_22950, partial [Acidobacteria bacterium]